MALRQKILLLLIDYVYSDNYNYLLHRCSSNIPNDDFEEIVATITLATASYL